MSLKYLTFVSPAYSDCFNYNKQFQITVKISTHGARYVQNVKHTFCFNCVSVIIYCSSFKDDPAVLQGTSCWVWIETSYTVSFSTSSLPACCFRSYYFFKIHCPLELASKGEKRKERKISFSPSFTSNMIANVSQAPLFLFFTNTYYWYVFAHCKDKL